MKIAFWGNFGTDNLGNECTLHAALAAARRHAAGAEILVVCSGPRDTAVRHRVEAVPIAPRVSTAVLPHPRPIRILRRLAAELRDWVRVVGIMRSTDVLIMTGTGLLTDRHEGSLGMPYQMFKWASAARMWRRELRFVSVGVEELVDPVRVRLMGWALRLAQHRSYRDPASRERARALLATSEPDPIFPDLAFSLPRSLNPGRDPSAGPPVVALGVYEGVEASAWPAYLGALGGFALRLLGRGFRVRIVIGDARYDPPAQERLVAWLRERGVGAEVVAEPATSFEELIDQLAGTSFVVATRFHNLILALLLGKPVVSLSHMDKNDELMAAMGLASYCVPLKELEPDRLMATFERLERHAHELRPGIEERNEAWREKLEEQYAAVFATAASQRPAGEPA